MIGDDIALSRVMADALARHGSFDVITQSLSITTFRYVPEDLRGSREDAGVAAYLDTLNAAILDALQKGGEVFVSNAVIHGRYALRACIVNFHTSVADVNAIPAIVAAYGARLDADLRAAHGRSLA
jgi:glutamate/tyrosine decarboxylase-like PLP-dependent enzyme